MESNNLRNRIRKSLVGVVSLVLFSAACANASTITWNTWNTSTTGTLANFSAGGSFASLVPGYPSYTPITTFADGTIVNNAPIAANGILQLTGGNSNVNTLTFLAPVVNPVLAIWSLGQGGVNASFNFNATPTYVAGGPSAEYGGSPISISGNNVYGAEGNGTVEFLGTFSSISWTNPVYENWYGFNTGIESYAAPVPEPGTMMLLGAGFLGLAVYGKRRKNA